MRRFEYFAPDSIPEALDFLKTYPGQTKILAGGTDLIVQIKGNEVKANYLLDLKRIQPLHGFYPTPEGGLVLRTLTTVSELAGSRGLGRNLSFLAEAAKTIGSIQVRNRATVGGNICRAAPSADLVPSLLVLEAQVKIIHAGGDRVVPLQEFFLGPGQTILQSDEILTEIHIPPSPSSGVGVYLKDGPRQAMDLAVVGAAVYLEMDSDPSCCKIIRISLASVAPTPLRGFRAEKVLVGNRLTPINIAEAARTASQEANPISDVYAPAWYKRQMVEVLVKRAILDAQSRVGDQKNEA
jgi:aerobic carbon-monoxide dehydrogenase medium subunit